VNETTLKLAAIRIGDTVRYLDSKKQVAQGVVQGWRDVQREGKWCKQLVLESGSCILLEYVVSRERREGCGTGVIVFSETAAQR